MSTLSICVIVGTSLIDLTGQWFKKNPGKREEIFLATKFANKALPGGGREVDSSPEYTRQSIEKSLKRLDLPFVDLYYVHRLDNKTPIEKTMVRSSSTCESGHPLTTDGGRVGSPQAATAGRQDQVHRTVGV